MTEEIERLEKLLEVASEALLEISNQCHLDYRKGIGYHKGVHEISLKAIRHLIKNGVIEA